MPAPYDLEARIMGCWQITHDLDDMHRHVVEMVDYGKLDTDEIANALLGLKTIYDIKFALLFADYEQSIRKNME